MKELLTILQADVMTPRKYDSYKVLVAKRLQERAMGSQNRRFWSQLVQIEGFGNKKSFSEMKKLLKGPFETSRYEARDPLRLFWRQLISHPYHGLNDKRIGRIKLDLAAEAIDHILQHCVIHLRAIAPDALIQFLDRDDLPGSIH